MSRERLACRAYPYNNSLERTCKNVTPFAYAKAAPTAQGRSS